MAINSCRKGKAGEREFASFLRETFGISARRSQQYAGGVDSSDIFSDLPVHFEVKRAERLNVGDAVSQAVRDSKEEKVPVVAHRRNRGEWLLTFRAKDLAMLTLEVNRILK